MNWKLKNKEIDKLWAKYEKENPAQEGEDTWDSRLINAQAKKLVEYLGWGRHHTSQIMIRLVEVRKEVGLE